MFIFKSDMCLLPAILACLGRSKPWTWGRGSSNGSHPCALQLFSLWKQRGDQQDQMEPLCHQPASLLAQWRLNRAPTSVVWEEFTWEGRDAPPFNPVWLLNDPFCGGVISGLFFTALFLLWCTTKWYSGKSERRNLSLYVREIFQKSLLYSPPQQSI